MRQWRTLLYGSGSNRLKFERVDVNIPAYDVIVGDLVADPPNRSNTVVLKRFYLSSAVFAAALVSSPLAHASVWLKTGSETSRPYGHVEYCNNNAGDCRSSGKSQTLPPARLSILKTINHVINKAIKPVSDLEQFGKREHWTATTDAGDCEDYALAKRRALLKHGFKASDLLLTMTRRRGEAHTVLVVRTRDGDYVLDNLRSAVLLVNKTGLGYVKMQSSDNARKWRSIIGKTTHLAEVR